MTAPNIYPTEDRHAQAAYWFVQLGQAECSAATRKAFAVWLDEDVSNRAAYERVQEAWSDSSVLEGSAVLDEVRRAALIESVRRPKRWWRMPRTYAAASGAAASVLLAMALLFPQGPDSAPGVQSASLTQPVLEPPQMTAASRTIATSVGERNSLPLPDGSLLELSTSTTVRVAFTDERREVVLVRGQAAFKVATDPERPFVVLAGDRRITAIGTEFEVRVENDDVAVTLLEGRVEVAEVRARNEAINPEQGIEAVALEPGQRLSARTGVAEDLEAGALERAMSWREGWLRFENDTLEDVVEEINRYSRRKFRLQSADLGDLRVSGSFRAGSVDSFASAIVEIYPVETYPDPAEADAVVIAWQTQGI